MSHFEGRRSPAMTTVAFRAAEYRADTSFRELDYEFADSTECIKAVVEHSRDKDSARMIETSLGDPASPHGSLGVCQRLAADLILGVAGESVLNGQDVAAWLLHNPGRELMLASGSTKTVEFADVARWLEALLRQPRPTLSGRTIEIRPAEVVDAHTGRVYGHRYSFQFDNGQRPSYLVFLAGLTPSEFSLLRRTDRGDRRRVGPTRHNHSGFFAVPRANRLPLRLQKVDSAWTRTATSSAAVPQTGGKGLDPDDFEVSSTGRRYCFRAVTRDSFGP